MIKKPSHQIFMTTIISMGCLLAAGCGQQGALYLPKPEQHTSIPAQAANPQSRTAQSTNELPSDFNEQQIKQMEQQILDNPNDY